MKKFKVGDLVIGNEKANRYGITKENTFLIYMKQKTKK